ncbi:MAG: hypothetical protein ACEPOW_13770 [Bacteroidales bacterium]
MAVNIQRVNSRIFTIDSDPKAKGYRAIADGDNIAIVSDGASTPNITNGRHFSNFITRSADGTILFDGTSGATVTQLVDSINEIANFSGGSVSVIPDNLIFADAAARDAYFNPNRLDELVTALEIILEDDGSGNRVFQRWTGESNPSVYPGTPADFWFTEGSDILTAVQIKTLYESNADTNALTDDKLQILDFLSLDPSGDVRSSRTFVFPPGSIRIGDSVIESGGRMISAKSSSTGNQGAFLIQLFSGTQYSKATVYDHTQVGALFDVQISNTDATSGTTTTTMRQVVQNAVQLQKVRFMPEGGTITQPFTFSVRLTELSEPIYSETVNTSDSNLANLGSGVWELELLNPSQFDAGFDAYISVTGLSLLGGNGFDGSDTVRFGDSTKSDFFMWLRTFSIPIVRQDIATEDFVADAVSGITGEHPVTLRRDMPSQADSLTLVNASLNDNSALWIISANQLGNSNRNTATIRALTPGQLDVNGDEIPITSVDASTIQLRAGTIVRIFGQDDFRTVYSPVLESDIPGGGQPTQAQARFTRFEFQSQPTSVAPGTSISGLKTFLINIERPDLLTGHLTILQGDTVLTENTLVPTVRSAGVPINAETLTNAGDTVTFTIRATTTSGAIINSRIVIRAYEPHELAYWGIRSSNDFTTVTLSELTSVDVTTNSSFTVSGDVDQNDYIGILVPTTHDIRSITLFNLPALDSFTRMENARVINSIQYHLYTKQSQAQFTTEVNAIINV